MEVIIVPYDYHGILEIRIIKFDAYYDNIDG